MRLAKSLNSVSLSYVIAATLWIGLPIEVCAQGGAPTVSAVTLKVVPGQSGQSVITPRGMVVPLPGAGVNSNAVQIFMGSQGGFWYVDRNGQNVDLTAGVHKLMAATGQTMPGSMQQVPQYAPMAPPVQQVVEQAPSSSGNSAMGTAAAAGLGAMGGAMAGAAISNSSYNNVPYGTPMYYPHNGTPYYHNPSGNTVNVENNQSYNPNYYNQHATNMQQQEQWYQHQQQANPQQYKGWQQTANQNPFVNSASQNPAAQNPAAAASKAEENGGRRFGRHRGESQTAAPNTVSGAAAQQDDGGKRGRFRRGGADASPAQAGAQADGEKRGGRFRRGDR